MMERSRVESALSIAGDAACILALFCIAMAFTAERLGSTRIERPFVVASIVFGVVLVAAEIARSFLRYRHSDKE